MRADAQRASSRARDAWGHHASPLHIYTDEQARIRRQRSAADDLLQRHEIKHETLLETLDHAPQLTDNIQAAYLQAASTERRLFNQALFETIAIDTEEIDGHELAPPFKLATLNHHYEEHSANGRPRRGTKKRTPTRQGSGVRTCHSWW